MDTAITFNSILGLFGIIVAVVAGIGAIGAIIKYLTDEHDRRQKWDAYDKQISEINTKITAMDEKISDDIKNAHKIACDEIQDYKTDTEAKFQEIRAELCMLTYCINAVLAGLKQQGCNGPVTEAKDKLDRYMNKQAHGVEN